MASLRTRLVLWFVAVLTAALLAFAVMLFLSVRYGLWREFDLRLRAVVDTTRDGLAPYWTIDGVSALDVAEALPEGETRWVEVWSLDGALLFRSRRAEAAPLPGAAPPIEDRLWSTAAADGEPRRVLDAVTQVIGLSVVMRVVESERPVRADVRTLASSIALGLVVCIAGAAWGGYRLTRRALGPMESLVAQTADITAERLKHGVTIVGADDEVAAVAAAFNTTLRRLDVSFEQARRFSADASHELRTPVTAIRSVGQVALQRGVDADGPREALVSMVEDAERLSRLLDTLLLLSRADAHQVELAQAPVDLAALVEAVVDDLRVVMDEREQTLTQVLAPATVRGDAGVLRLAIGNLVDNAVRYTPTHGRLSVTLGADAAAAVVAVQDSGPGIAAEHHARLFDRFYRVEAARSSAPRGSGLGLSIAAWAATVHGGSITVDSAPGRGSTFTLRLPLAPAHDLRGQSA